MSRTASSQGISLREATTSDLAEVLALLRKADLPVAGVREALDDFVVAENSGKVVGAAGLEIYGPFALLRSVIVDERHRGMGLGERLIERALCAAKPRGVEEVFLLTTTAADYFPRFGFARISRENVPAAMTASAEFQGACPSSAVLMRLTFEA